MYKIGCWSLTSHSETIRAQSWSPHWWRLLSHGGTPSPHPFYHFHGIFHYQLSMLGYRYLHLWKPQKPPYFAGRWNVGTSPDRSPKNNVWSGWGTPQDRQKTPCGALLLRCVATPLGENGTPTLRDRIQREKCCCEVTKMGILHGFLLSDCFLGFLCTLVLWKKVWEESCLQLVGNPLSNFGCRGIQSRPSCTWKKMRWKSCWLL